MAASASTERGPPDRRGAETEASRDDERLTAKLSSRSRRTARRTVVPAARR